MRVEFLGLSALLCFIVGIFSFVQFLTRRPKEDPEAVPQTSTAVRTRPRLFKDESRSVIPALDKLLRAWSFLGVWQRILDQADVKQRPATILLLSLVLALLTGYLARMAYAPVVLMGGGTIAAAGAPFLYLFYQRRRRWRAFQAQLPDALTLCVRALRAGHTLTHAIERVAHETHGPIAVEFEKVFVHQSLGLSLSEALTHLSDRVPLPDVRFLVSAMQIQKETGGPLAEVLDNLSQSIRARDTLLRHIRAVSAQGRLSGKILSLIPVGVGTLMYLASPDYFSILWDEPLGRALLWGLLIGQLCGFLTIRNIVRIKV